MCELLVRQFAPDEWRLYRTLRLAALAESPDAFGSTLAHELARTDPAWATRLARGAQSAHELPLIAQIDSEPAGLAWVWLEDGDPAKPAHLQQMWVTPQTRRQGVGRALLDAAIAWARRVGARAVTLDVTTGNTDAVRLYEAAGFVPTGSERALRPGSTLRSRAMQLPLRSAFPEPSA
jgi:ribosomal protein S18 acetylase RimI-like enzyme